MKMIIGKLIDMMVIKNFSKHWKKRYFMCGIETMIFFVTKNGVRAGQTRRVPDGPAGIGLRF